MTRRRVALNVYRVREEVDARRVARPDDVVLPREGLASHEPPAWRQVQNLRRMGCRVALNRIPIRTERRIRRRGEG